ncbi:Uncharacterised protein [Vibrio cholerae]|nr:Uncharacterised protein [Vibrio cholerae]CSB35279.1 Uncharacterised protein [Vibrio cholerae]CSB59595.1 Uncharacterised protein [Vibrio cholerae]CSB93250.1 Uncharacterised protein [Vibrio cholerae]CSC46044.1 Uncharacterised protein [Vibrio cholerae]
MSELVISLVTFKLGQHPVRIGFIQRAPFSAIPQGLLNGGAITARAILAF